MILRGDARHLPLDDESVDCIVTSPPYWGQRSYRDAGSHYDGQIGSEPHPRLWLEAMFDVMKECWRVVKPEGSVFVNLGDKRAGSGGHNNSGLAHGREVSSNGIGPPASRRNAPDRYQQAHFGRPKSRQLLPERFAIGCEDGLADPEGVGWIVRQIIVWHKANGLPESVEDRTRDNFEVIYHLTKSERYYSAVDEIREPLASKTLTHRGNGQAWGNDENPDNNWNGNGKSRAPNMAGALPGSVWRIASEPLTIPDYFLEVDSEWQGIIKGKLAKPKSGEGGGMFDYPQAMQPVYPGLVKLWRMVEQRMLRGLTTPMILLDMAHYAAFPSELPRRLILGWSPPAICLRCGEGRRPVLERLPGTKERETPRYSPDANHGGNGSTLGSRGPEATILGYACSCCPFTDHPGSESKRMPITNGKQQGTSWENPSGGLANNPRTGPWREYHLDRWTPPPSRPAAVLDPFCGTGTTVGVAEALGRKGIGVELSADYCRLAQWRVGQPGQWQKATARTWQEAQGVLL